MDLSSDEREIYTYLKSYSDQFISEREICRRAGSKRRFQEDANWAIRVLPRLIEKGAIEQDSNGRYRAKDVAEKENEEVKVARKEDAKPKTKKRWVSPHIERILKQSGKKFEEID